VTIFVEVPDVNAALQRAEELGGKRMLGPDPLLPGVEIGRFADPEGHLIGVITQRESGHQDGAGTI
jgi:predicted enzyme related to lactoylglutathione lyase